MCLSNVWPRKKIQWKSRLAHFKTARDLAFNKQRKQAQDTLVNILTKYPNYHDVRTFLATTYSWDGDHKKAKSEFDYVLDKDPKNKEAWQGTIQNQLWADKNTVYCLRNVGTGIETTS